MHVVLLPRTHGGRPPGASWPAHCVRSAAGTVLATSNLEASFDLTSLVSSGEGKGAVDIGKRNTDHATAAPRPGFGSGLRDALVEHSPTGILLFDHNGQCVVANHAAARILGMSTPTDLMGQLNILDQGLRHSSELLFHVRRAFEGVRSETPPLRLGAGGNRAGADVQLASADPESAPRPWVAARFVPLRARDRAVGHVLAFLQEVTSEVQARHEAARAAQELVLLNDVLAHDITNYHHVMRGYLELLQRADVGPLNDDQQQFVDKCIDQLDRSTSLTDNARDLSALKGITRNSFVELDLAELLEQALEQVQERFRHRRLQVSYPQDRGMTVQGSSLLGSVFRNVLTNAIRHNESPEVRIGIQIEAQPGKVGAAWRIEISDNGPGIPDRLKEVVFERFESAGQVKGTGLGLSIVKALVTLHGGRVWVEDVEEGDSTRGSRFVVLLPRG